MWVCSICVSKFIEVIAVSMKRLSKVFLCVLCLIFLRSFKFVKLFDLFTYIFLNGIYTS